jgi:hypothetical protein
MIKYCHTRSCRRPGRAVAEAEAVAVVDRVLVRIFLPNSYAFCLE